jgi:hypothetical protein
VRREVFQAVFCTSTYELFAIKSLVPQTAHRAVLQALGPVLQVVLQYVRHAVLLRAAIQPVRRAGRQYVVHRVVHCHVHRCVLLRYAIIALIYR